MIDKLKLLFHNHNEHIILLSKITALVYYKIFGEISFKNLIIFQNLFLFGHIWLIIKVCSLQKINFNEVLLPITFCLFNFSFWYCIFFYSGGIQYYASPFFCILSLIFFYQSSTFFSINFFGGVICLVLAICSFGNGIITIPLGCLILWSQNKRKLLVTLITISIVIVYGVFLNQSTKSTSFHDFDLLKAVKLFFTFLGSSVFLNFSQKYINLINVYFCFILGLLIFIFWSYLFFKGYEKERPLLFGLLSIPILTGVIIAFARYKTGMLGGLVTRYMFFSEIVPIAVLLILQDKGYLYKIRSQVIIFFVLIWGLILYNIYPKINASNAEITGLYETWLVDKKKGLLPNYPNELHYGGILEEAIEKRVLKIETVKK